ncbi:MAG: squalene synthase HpnC [Chloroflexi bacterium]|nr:squalene synthase HpnC [Chloroflexota bacterium]
MTLPFAESGSSIEEAFAACERLTRSHYENFSVATRLLPRDLRRHFFSIYAFCRGVDDLGDEVDGDRLALLDAWEAELEAAYSGTPSHPYFVALRQTIREFDIPKEPLLKLIEANRRDQSITRYPDFDELLGYCEYSANPVGSLVLYVFGHREPELHRLSDYTCTALQLTNFWQDVARDFDIGRIYIPGDTMERFGVQENDIREKRATPQFKAALKFEVDRARELFRKGIPLIDRVQGKARIDIALFTAGGMAILDKIESRDYDVLTRRPALSKREKAVLFARTQIRSKLRMHPLPKKYRDGRGR